MTDYYVDQVLGSWSLKKQTKSHLLYERRGEANVTKDNAILKYEEEETATKVHGLVILWEQKRIDIPTSTISLFRGLDKTTKSVTEKVI
jgi:hypothetical protein